MKTRTALLLIIAAALQAAAVADDDFRVATVIKSAALEAAMVEAPADAVSDQPISHVESAEGRLGLGVVHRPRIEPGAPIQAIQHHIQSEVYRVMAGAGVLVTSTTMRDSQPLDAEGYIVTNLVGPSDVGTIADVQHSQPISEGDIVIIPAGVAHGFSEISEPITYMVVRIDPERLVELK